MLPLQFEPTAEIGYVEIPRELMLALIRREHALRPHGATLYSKLADLPGISDIEYDGHFGSHVFFTKDGEATVEQMQTVFRTISDYLMECAAWAEKNPAKG